MKRYRAECHNPRIGYDLIVREIPDRSRVLDLGCGDGELLVTLRTEKSIEGFGVELSSSGVTSCLEKGLYCYQGDIDEGLADYRDNSFDYVILNQTLQDTKKPEYVLQEIMRISRFAIISFPNFAHLSVRLEHLRHGTMPKNRLFPYDWYASPNIHLLSIKDFQEYCLSHLYPLHDEMHFSMRSDGCSRRVRILPNLFAEYGLFILDGEKYSAYNA